MAQALYHLTVAETARISPSMHQITLEGDDLLAFPPGQEGGYFKLLLNADCEASGAGQKPLMRTYTIRRQRERAIDVLFALHGDHAAGAATSWALSAKPGDAMTIRGPGRAKPSPVGCDFYLIAGDMAALPAISANLEAMDRSARGIALLEIQHPEDAIAIDAPAGIELRWIVNAEPGLHPDLLADAMRAIDLPQGVIAGWAACEFEAMKRLRALMRDDFGIALRHLYTSSYWKLGLNETEHKRVKREDAEREGVPIG